MGIVVDTSGEGAHAGAEAGPKATLADALAVALELAVEVGGAPLLARYAAGERTDRLLVDVARSTSARRAWGHGRAGQIAEVLHHVARAIEHALWHDIWAPYVVPAALAQSQHAAAFALEVAADCGLWNAAGQAPRASDPGVSMKEPS